MDKDWSGIREVLPELIKRVESGTGPDRDIDIEIWRGLCDGRADRYPLPWDYQFTVSMDDVLTLIEKRLPGWCWQARHGFGFEAIVWQVCKDYDDEGCKTIGSSQSSGARALLAATLRAISELENGPAILADAHSKSDPHPEPVKEG